MPKMKTDVLEIAYLEGGPRDGPPALLLHGWPDDVRGWSGVVLALEAAGFHWVAPWLRGFGPTRFLQASAVRDGRGVALARDALDLADGLGWDRFAVAGHDWGARAAYIMAALAPERLTRVATLALGYAPHAAFPTPAYAQSKRWWYQWFMTTDRGAAAVRADPRGFARIQWDTWSPLGWFDNAEFDATAASFDNPDWVAITLHGYRSRWKAEPCDPRYAEPQARLETVGSLSTPTLLIQGGADACDPPAESDDQARHFHGGYRRVVLGGVGHFPTREAPLEVGELIVEHFGGQGEATTVFDGTVRENSILVLRALAGDSHH